jgi:hypothetical protein
MIRFRSQPTIFRVSSQCPTIELYLKLTKMRFSPHYSSDLHASFCQFRSELEENLVDKRVRFRFHEKQIASNIHRGAEAGLGP